jgi:L-lysine exporter family protein LysE/ArgO
VGAFIFTSSTLSLIVSIGGAGFLFVYGLGSFRSAIKGGSLSADYKTQNSLKAAVFTTLSVILLNPHVYIDTVILIDSIAS